MSLTPADVGLFKKPSYSPYSGRRLRAQVFWGDTHLHTSNSFDARAFGVTLGPEQAYRLAHNGNLSNGIMFPVETNPETGQPLTGAYAETRAKWEPLYEETQIKGDGETHPFPSPNDESADYETWDKSNLSPVLKKSAQRSKARRHHDEP